MSARRIQLFLFILLMSGLIACKVFKVVEKHIDKRMTAADMHLNVELIEADTIEYWDNGSDKPVIVLVHGFGASTKYQWFEQVEWLSQYYRVIMPNLNYFGRSRPAEADYTVDGQVKLVHKLLDHLKVEKYALCGISYGGLTIFEMALQRPEAITVMIGLDAPVKYMYEKDIAVVCERFDVQSVQELFAPSNPKGLKKLLYLATLKKSIIPASWLKEFHEQLYMVDLEDKRMLITQLLADVEMFNAREYKLEMPILLIWGDNDPVIPADRGELLRQHLGENTRLEYIHNGSHAPNLAKTKAFNKLFQAYLEEAMP